MEWSRETFPLCVHVTVYVCVCVFAREPSACRCVGARVRPCACTRARNGPGEGSGLVPRWGPGGPRARRRKRHQDQRVIRAARRGRIRGEGGATFCRPCRRGKMGTIIRHQGVHPFRSSPFHSYDIYLGISVSPSSPCPAAFDQISVTAVSFQDEGRVPLTLA